ncbi:hypothetical protein TNCV_2993591 [Trichonephila clavipes]|nr:hypothetical protein TNCV_2993591 [Trichonephila clavipes]
MALRKGLSPDEFANLLKELFLRMNRMVLYSPKNWEFWMKLALCNDRRPCIGLPPYTIIQSKGGSRSRRLTVLRNSVLDLNGQLTTSSREDRHVTRMTLMDRAAMTRALSQ